jgi:hypothetical protein
VEGGECALRMTLPGERMQRALRLPAPARTRQVARYGGLSREDYSSSVSSSSVCAESVRARHGSARTSSSSSDVGQASSVSMMAS